MRTFFLTTGCGFHGDMYFTPAIPLFLFDFDFGFAADVRVGPRIAHATNLSCWRRQHERRYSDATHLDIHNLVLSLSTRFASILHNEIDIDGSVLVVSHED